MSHITTPDPAAQVDAQWRQHASQVVEQARKWPTVVLDQYHRAPRTLRVIAEDGAGDQLAWTIRTAEADLFARLAVFTEHAMRVLPRRVRKQVEQVVPSREQAFGEDKSADAVPAA